MVSTDENEIPTMLVGGNFAGDTFRFGAEKPSGLKIPHSLNKVVTFHFFASTAPIDGLCIQRSPRDKWPWPAVYVCRADTGQLLEVGLKPPREDDFVMLYYKHLTIRYHPSGLEIPFFDFRYASPLNFILKTTQWCDRQDAVPDTTTAVPSMLCVLCQPICPVGLLCICEAEETDGLAARYAGPIIWSTALSNVRLADTSKGAKWIEAYVAHQFFGRTVTKEFIGHVNTEEDVLYFSGDRTSCRLGASACSISLRRLREEIWLADGFAPTVADFIAGNVIRDGGCHVTKDRVSRAIIEYLSGFESSGAHDIHTWTCKVWSILRNSCMATEDVSKNVFIGYRLRRGPVIRNALSAVGCRE